MLSILQRQAKLMESELKDKRLEISRLGQAARARDVRVAELEAELLALRNAGSAPTTPTTPMTEAAVVDAVIDATALSELTAYLAKLQKLLVKREDELTFAQLRKSVVELEATSATVRHALAVLTKDESIGALEAKLRAMSAELEALRKALGANELLLCEQTQTRADVERRDEQLEFLVNVHEASTRCTWVPDQTSDQTPSAPACPAVGSARNAALARSREDPLSTLEAMGVDTESARAALESTSGDLRMAIAALFGEPS